MPRGENRPSVLLSRDENDLVFSLIGPKCQSLATTVVQLFTTEGPAHSEWKKKDTGVLCLIKDNGRRSYFFRVYCLYRKALIWEHEVYVQIEYKSPRPYLHTFEAEDYMTAFNFASEDEARVLKNMLVEKIEMRKRRREVRKNRSMQAARVSSDSSYGSSFSISSRMNGGHAPPAPLPPAPLTPAPVPTPLPVSLPSSKSNTLSNYTLKSSSKKPKARKLTKADIGMPQDFKHVSHVGWDANKGFDVDLPEEEMRSFFSKAGISEKQLEDHATREFIYDFINSHGGVDAVKEELHDIPKETIRGPAPPPAPPVPARVPHSQHPPAPPSRAPPPPPARAVPPPPPPPATLTAPRNPPPPRPMQPPTTAPPSVPPPVPPPPPPPSSSAPPPPPPPPPTAPAAPPAPPPPPMPADTSLPTDTRAALMESIRSGNKTLKHVDVGSKNSLNEDNRSNLLSEIRQGINLRAVRRSSSTNAEDLPGPEACGLAGALARALRERARVIQSSDSEDSDNEASDFEWD